MSEDAPPDYDVGYGRPPKHTQFQKGQSGNKAGRPRKKRSKDDRPLLPGIYPTRSVLRDDAHLLVTIREGDRRTQIPTTAAVVRALAKMAMEGGVMAARTYLELQATEDERIAAEREKSFQFWLKYVTEKKAEIKRAQTRGATPPDPVPHPDDIRLSHTDRTVEFIGPVTHEDADQARYTQQVSHLVYELGRYHREDCEYAGNLPDARVGFWFLSFIELQAHLPVRLRGISDDLHTQIIMRIGWRFPKWTEYLQNRCRELGIPFVKYKRPMQAWTLREASTLAAFSSL